MSRRGVVLCADDYGISEGVSRAILSLADRGRLSATSAMTNMPAAERAAALLRDAAPRISVGLHLTLTWGRPLGPAPRLAPGGALPDLQTLLAQSFSGRIPGDEVSAEIRRQTDRFVALFGRQPDFVDGHQHVHVLPGIRGALLRQFAGTGVWIRDPGDRADRILRRRAAVPKALLLSGFALGLRGQAGRAGIATNRGFAGFSDFAPERDVERDFARYLAAPGPGHLVMCHPGEVAPGERLDGIEAAREAEWRYLASPAFGALLARRDVRLVPRPDQLA